MEKTAQPSRLRKAGIIFLTGCLILLGGIALLNRKSEFVALNQTVQYDDFAFAVEEYHVAKTVGRGETALPAQGRFYVVRLRVENRARRVPFTFRSETARLVDDSGQDHGSSVVALGALESEGVTLDRCLPDLPAGSTCTEILVFDLPVETQKPTLRFSFGNRLLDLLDTIFYGVKQISL